ncbi:MAG: aminotransferase class I and II [Acidobacteria bacterium]|nr:MAG: aminotransferase class I and II [Acidobacteriota bacterium]REK00127.1 MAG: aminotransferase class I and II [Acidobacteriota bacterium]
MPLDSTSAPPLWTHDRAVRYVVPLREGGSLPAVVETEDGATVVLKFRGSGQGAKALVAELVVGGLARSWGLPVPELRVVELDDDFGRLEPDPEIQDVLRASRGVNVGMDFLAGAYNFDAAADLDGVDPLLASRIVCLDALCWNIDRTARNPNLMVQGGGLWMIDHGAALYPHHDWATVDEAKASRRFAQLADHVLLPRASALRSTADEARRALADDVIDRVLDAVPDALLLDAPAGVQADFEHGGEARAAYRGLLRARVRSVTTVLGLTA